MVKKKLAIVEKQVKQQSSTSERNRRIAKKLKKRAGPRVISGNELVVPENKVQDEQNEEKQSPELNMNVCNEKDISQIIHKYHTLNKYLEAIEHDPRLSLIEKEQKKKKIEIELKKIGGLEAYQKASIAGQSCEQYHKFNSGKWVIHELKKRGYDKEKLKLLDVGALTNHFLSCSGWIDVVPIDLQPQHPSVIKADFFDFTMPCNQQVQIEDGVQSERISKLVYPNYDIVVLSLVINFIGDPRRRGEMLLRCRKLLEKSKQNSNMAYYGLLFIVLPLACIDNSRYINQETFIQILDILGFDFESDSKSNKLCFYVFRRRQHDIKTSIPLTEMEEYIKYTRRILCRSGDQKNNFCILLPEKNHQKKKKKKKNSNL